MQRNPERSNPQDQGGSSYLLIHWATRILSTILDADPDAENYDDPVRVAFGTANKLLQSTGLRVEGSSKLTVAGREREAELLQRTTPAEIEAEYKRTLSRVTRLNGPDNISRYRKLGGTHIAALDCSLMDADANIWWLARLFVPDGMRGRGAAKTLLAEVLEDLDATGPGWIVVAPGGYEFDPTTRTAIYKKLGFKPLPDTDEEVLYLPFNGAIGAPPIPF